MERAAAHKPHIMCDAKPQLQWKKACWTVEQWKRALWVMDHVSPSGRRMDESGLGSQSAAYQNAVKSGGGVVV